MKKGLEFYILISILVLSISLIILFGLSVKASDSENTSSSEWWMYGKFLNHTAWDGVSFNIPSMNFTTFTTENYDDFGNSVFSSPSVVNGFVYVGNSAGMFYRLNASNISQKLDSFNATPIATGQLQSPPAIVNGYVYFGGTSSNIFFRLNATNFSQYNSSGTAAYNIPITIANGFAYTLSGSGAKIRQYNATDLSLVGNYSPSQNQMDMTPTYANGFIYTGAFSNGNPQFLQFNASNISQGPIGNFTTQGYTGTGSGGMSPAIWNGSVYFVTAFNSQNSTPATVYQLNATNISSVFGTFTATGGSGSVFYGPTIATDPTTNRTYVYVSDVGFPKMLYQLNASNVSQKIANYSSSSGYFSGMTVANGYLYSGTSDGYVFQFNATNISKVVGRVYIGSAIAGTVSPAYANGFIYFGAQNGLVYQLNATNLSSYLVNDTTIPTVTFNAPSNFTTYSGTFPISIGLNKQGYCNYSFNNGTTNYTLTPTYPFTIPANEWHGVSPTISDGTYTVIAYCIDSFGNANYNTTVTVTMYTSPPLPSELPQGGLPPSQPMTQSFSSITSGQSVVVPINNPDVSVTNITIKATQNITSAALTFQQNLANSTIINFKISNNANGVVYQAFDIIGTNLNSTDMTATIQFRVNKTWITQNGVNPNRLRLYRQPTGTTTWTKLTTTQVGQDANYYYYSAVTPGFSTFVVFFNLDECTGGAVRCLENQVQTCDSDNSWTLTESCPYGCNNGRCESQFNIVNIIKNLFTGNSVYYIMLGIVIFGVAMTIYFISKSRKRRKNIP